MLVVINTVDAGPRYTDFEGDDMAVSFALGTVLAEAFPDTSMVAADGTVRVEVGAWEGLVLVAE